MVIALTLINSTRARNWARLQIILTVIPLVTLTLLAFFVIGTDHALPAAAPVAPGAGVTLSGLVSAYVGIYFAYSGWNAIIYLAGEVKNPEKTIPASLIGGTVLVTLLYLLLCWSFVLALGMDGLAGAGEAGSAVAHRVNPVYGRGIVGVLIACALLASLNASIMGGARIAYAMSRAGVVWSKFAEVNPVNHQPVNALRFQALWVILLIFSGTFHDLVQLTGLAMLVTGTLTVLALFKLRQTEPQRERPYRSIRYPLFPSLYIVANLSVIAFKIVEAAQFDSTQWFPLLGVFIFCAAFAGHLGWRRFAANSSVL